MYNIRQECFLFSFDILKNLPQLNFPFRDVLVRQEVTMSLRMGVHWLFPLNGVFSPLNCHPQPTLAPLSSIRQTQ